MERRGESPRDDLPSFPTAPLQFGIACCAIAMLIVLAVALTGHG